MSENDVKEVKITPKQKRFCEEYIKTYNATKACSDAGFSKNRASEIGYQLLQKTTVKDYIHTLEVERANKAEIDEVELIKDLKNIKNNESLKPADRLKAMELLGRYKGMDKTKSDNTVRIIVGVIEDDEEPTE